MNVIKNWPGTSTAVEAHIIVDGFRQSIEMHNLTCNQIIEDGDSSVIIKKNSSSAAIR